MLLTDRRLSTRYEGDGKKGEQEATARSGWEKKVFYFDGKAAYTIKLMTYRAALTIPQKLLARADKVIK